MLCCQFKHLCSLYRHCVFFLVYRPTCQVYLTELRKCLKVIALYKCQAIIVETLIFMGDEQLIRRQATFWIYSPALTVFRKLDYNQRIEMVERSILSPPSRTRHWNTTRSIHRIHPHRSAAIHQAV